MVKRWSESPQYERQSDALDDEIDIGDMPRPKISVWQSKAAFLGQSRSK
jgi:hypothetical protein